MITTISIGGGLYPSTGESAQTSVPDAAKVQACAAHRTSSTIHIVHCAVVALLDTPQKTRCRPKYHERRLRSFSAVGITGLFNWVDPAFVRNP